MDSPTKIERTPMAQFGAEQDAENLITAEQLKIGKSKIEGLNEDLNDCIRNLSEDLDKKLQKQEHDYLKGYSLYVKKKEQELRKIIADLNRKNESNTEKDQIIVELKNTIKR